jgi:predicted HAD superfamily hydrolase
MISTTTPIASFDVFDTVLTRVVGAPVSVFLLLGHRLQRRGLITCSAEVFARARRDAQKLARRHRASGEVTLALIYRQLGAALGLDAERQQRLAEEEQRLEAELICVVPAGQQQVAEARQQGRAVRFLSDMYLPQAFVESQLQQHGLWSAGDRCYLSGEQDLNKANGALFTAMLRHEGVGTAAVAHSGNDWFADVISPRRLGITTRHRPQANPNRYESRLESQAFATEGLSSLLAGAARLARLQETPADETEAVLREVAAGVAAPLLVGYVLWVLRQAQTRKLRQLFFVSREGQVLLQLARILAPKVGVGVSLRYLYGSRQAWNQPALRELGTVAWNWILGKPGASAEQVLARAGLQPDELREHLTGVGITESAWRLPLDRGQSAALAQRLTRPEIQGLILERAAVNRQMLIRYLEQEGLLGSSDWALVDTGWYGGSQRSLSTVLRGLNRPAALALYIAQFRMETDPQMGPYETYLWDEAQRIGRPPEIPHFPTLVETLCPSDHGTVCGYREGADGRIEPNLKVHSIRSHARQLQRVIGAVAAQLRLDNELTNPWADLRPAILETLKLFWLSPTAAEARVWGGWPLETDQGTACGQLARPYGVNQFGRAFRHGEVVHEDCPFWPAASWLATAGSRRLLLRLATGPYHWRDLAPRRVAGATRQLLGRMARTVVRGRNGDAGHHRQSAR